jgi:hypothetical protein
MLACLPPVLLNAMPPTWAPAASSAALELTVKAMVEFAVVSVPEVDEAVSRLGTLAMA